jgi:thiamine biosynthesis lipoprotein
MKWSFAALGTTWWIEVFDDLTSNTSDEVKDFVAGFVTTYENNYSRFKSDSLLSTLNRERTLSHPPVELVELLEYGKQLYLRSDTHFNFLTGHILEARGYNADYTFKDTLSDVPAGNPITDLTISPQKIELRHGNLDLGGFGKGYLIDLVAKAFKDTFALEQFLINGGGDMYATHHNGAPVEIYLEHPINHGTILTSTHLRNQGFAASSPHRRVWQNSTGTHHHIISSDITADGVFVKAGTTADADAFATTILQLEKQQIETLAQDEHLAVAQYDNTTSALTQSRNFSQFK